jgi:glycosyltransferase involved in cell wall biosynthesis
VRVAEGLAERGHSVTVVTTRHEGNLARDESVRGVRVIRLQPIARFSRGMIAPAFPFAAAKLIAQSDVVQIHTPLPEAGIVALLCRVFGRPLLMTHHGDLVMPSGVVNQTLQRIGYLILSSAAGMADAVTTYSYDYSEHSALLRNLKSNLFAIHPPVEMPEPEEEAAELWRSELGLGGKSIIGLAGRWVEEKGFDFLLEALPIILDQCPEAHLVYAGEQHVVYDHFFERCLRLVQDQREHITLLGLLRDPQRMANFYHMCDVFVQPSRTDMMGLVQVEAMLCGTPVVASDIPGARVVVGETGFGCLATPGDPAALAQTIVHVLRNRERYKPSRGAVAALFSTDRALTQYEDVIKFIVSGRSRIPRALTPQAIRSLSPDPETGGRKKTISGLEKNPPPR